MESTSRERIISRYLGPCLTFSFLFIWCLSQFLYIYRPLIFYNPSLIDIILTLLFVCVMGITFWCFILLMIGRPAELPSWLAETRVEAFVRGILADIVRESNNNNSDNNNNNNNNNNSDNNKSVNMILIKAQQQEEEEEKEKEQKVNRPIEEFHNKTFNTPSSTMKVSVNSTNSNKEGIITQPKEIKEIKEENIQNIENIESEHWWKPIRSSSRHRDAHITALQLFRPTLNISLVASDAISALNFSPESFQQEISFLLGGARHCQYCHIYKLYETHHCMICNTCVYQMDQHYPWIGQCAGVHNHKYYLLFLFYLTLSSWITTIHVCFILFSAEAYIFGKYISMLLFFNIFIIGAAVGLVSFALFIQNIYLLLQGESVLQFTRRIEREMQAQRRQGNFTIIQEHNEPTISINEEEIEIININERRRRRKAKNRFNFKNFRRVFGLSSVFPYWMLPIPPRRPSLQVQEATFWENQRKILLKQLESIVEAE